MPTPVRVAVVYHSGFGHTQEQARAVARGAALVPECSVNLIDVTSPDLPWPELLEMDALIFGCPTYMGSVSVPFKTFVEETSRKVMGAGSVWQDKVAAGFTNSGALAGDKLGALFQLALFAAQHGMHWINLALPAANNSSGPTGTELNRLGFWLGAAAQSNVDEPAAKAPPQADLETASRL